MICSVLCTKENIEEFDILKTSFDTFHDKTRWGMICDEETSNYFKDRDIEILEVVDRNVLFSKNNKEKYSHIFYNNTLASYKLKTIEMMLDKYGETLHLDTDIIFFNSISNEIKNKKFQAAYAPHYFFKKDSPVSNRFGYFNAGVIWIRDKEFWNEWNDLTKTGNHFFEQKPLEIMYDKGNFDILKLPKTYNFANGNRDRENIHLDGDGFIYYKEDPLINIHVHIFKQNIHLGDNSLEMKKKIKELLHKSKNENYKNIKRVIKKHDKKNFYEF